MQENSKKIPAESSGKNRKDSHRSDRTHRKSVGGGETTSTKTVNGGTVNTKTTKHSSSSSAKEVMVMNNSDSSSSGIGSSSSRLSSSGGSSDAVDTCDTNTTTGHVAPRDGEVPRVPDLHPNHNELAETAQSSPGGHQLGRQPKEPLSRASSINDDDSGGKMIVYDHCSPSMAAKSLSKKKRKKRLDKTTVLSRDCSPTIPSVSSSSSRPDNSKSVINHHQTNQHQQSGKNASTRFSCEAGPRIPKR
jgi:hypothetical protein